jgi:Tfp pilus assembly protein PilF
MDRIAQLVHGAAALAAGQLAEAETTYRSLLAETPNDAEVLSNLGAVYNVAQCHEAAEAACRAALANVPGYWAALANLGTTLHRQQRFEEAISTYLDAVRANPRNSSAWTNLGVALTEQGRPKESLPIHDAAVALAPNDAEVHNNRALALLSAGDYVNGFMEFDWRWHTPAMSAHRLQGRRWRGAKLGERIEGRRILLYEEGGFGDTLQFIRYVPQVAALGAQVIVRVQPELQRLLQRSFPGITIVTTNDTLPDHDVQSPLLSLPRCFGTSVESVPADLPYLQTNQQASASWRARLDHAFGKHKLRVGLVWSGAPRLGMAQMRAMDSRRSMPAAKLAPLACVPGIAWVSLQYPPPEPGQQPPLPGVFDPMPEIADFDDTASLVEALDLVIAVDTSTAHLAGALGKPVWLLSRFDACWRWIAGRTDSPWYPTMRIYRQPRPGDWETVLTQVTEALRLVAQSRADAPIPP